ncbi:hypothetical protein [Paraburkholderia sp. BL21I4N1]|uniref:hypothetical protein n=1 Tax=Paraburkholderia sp. BL21I4N1 TaxID=1938801 RepID=UPI000D4533BC|nr:hypothetical protein [Paraburkholderia sp. BL21I4N1]PQV51798.1 hypothetical protein B0G83_1045 [Paraburkholderia sp. BL21I4N1]
MNALTDVQLKAVYSGLAKAGLNGYRIVSLHLEPTTAAAPGALAARDIAAAAPDVTNLCHAQQLPSGGYVINCDPQ